MPDRGGNRTVGVDLMFQSRSFRAAAVTVNNNATTSTPTGAANDEESDVMTTMEKLEAEAKDVSPCEACPSFVAVALLCIWFAWVKLSPVFSFLLYCPYCGLSLKIKVKTTEMFGRIRDFFFCSTHILDFPQK